MAAFVISDARARLAGGLFAFMTGSVFSTCIAIGKSADVLRMVLLGGINAVLGPIVGYDLMLPVASMWRLALRLTIITLVLAFPADSPAAGPVGRHDAAFGPRSEKSIRRN